MKSIKNYLVEFCRDEEGLTTVEYAVAGAMIATAVVTAFRTLGTDVKGVIEGISTELTSG